MTFWAFSQLSACMLPDVSMTKMMYSLSTGMPPTDERGVDALRRVLEQALHFRGQRLVRGHELGLDDVGDRRLALARLELAADLRDFAGERRRPLLLDREHLGAPLQLAIEHVGFAAQLEQLALQRRGSAASDPSRCAR